MDNLEIKTSSYNTAVGQSCPTIVSEGHHYWVDKDGNDHIYFHNNSVGKLLKDMWDKLHEPIRRNKNGKAHRLSR